MTDRQDCPFRHENGNCLRIGGFCLAVSDEMCTAIQGAYARGVADAISFVNSAKEIEKVNSIKRAEEGSELGLTDREKIIFGLKCLTNEDPYMSRISCKKKKCPYAETETDNCAPAIWRDALDLLKKQEPHLLTMEDFVRADHYGYLAAWTEERNGSQFWKLITIRALECDKKRMRYWSSRPTNEQREEMKWDAPTD